MRWAGPTRTGSGVDESRGEVADRGPGAVDLGEAVDVHQHWLPRELVQRVREYLPDGYSMREEGMTRHIFDPNGQRVQSIHAEEFPDVEQRLRLMDEAGIQMALLSPGCFPQWMTLKAARLINEAAADLAKRHGVRLKPMVNVPPFGEPGIVEEMERGAKLGLTGVCISTNFGGLYPDEEAYRPFLRKAAELDLPVFVHAAGTPVHYEDMRKFNLSTPVGRGLDHTLVVVRVLYSGVLEDIPNLKMVMAHLGGSYFAHVRRFIGKSFEQAHAFPVERAERVMQRLLFDTAPSFWNGPTEIQCALDNLGSERLALGSDYPHGSRTLQDATAHLRALKVDNRTKRQVAGENLRALYGLR